MSHYKDAMLAAGKAYWEALLARHGNNITHAARAAGVYRQDVYKYLKRYGVAYCTHKGARAHRHQPPRVQSVRSSAGDLYSTVRHA